MVIISHEHKFIYVHVTKTAGSAITAALAPHLPYKHQYQKDIPGWQPKFHAIGGMHGKLPFKIYEKCKKYKIIASVRNPWDRMRSLYRVYLNPKYTIFKTSGFEDFLKTYRTMPTKNPSHMRVQMQQVDWFRNGSLIMANEILRFESLARDVEMLSKKMGLKLDLQRRNVHPYDTFGKVPPLEELYTDWAKDYVADWFKDDIKLWGYEFPSHKD